MIFPPVTTTEVCLCFTLLCVHMCVCVCNAKKITCKGFPRATFRGSWGFPLGYDCFSSAVVTKTHTLSGSNTTLCQNIAVETHTYTSTRTHETKSEQQFSLNHFVPPFVYACMQQRIIQKTQITSLWIPRTSTFLSRTKICLHSKMCRFYTFSYRYNKAENIEFIFSKHSPNSYRGFI